MPARNPQRAQRAIEVALLSGRPLSVLQRELKSAPVARPAWFLMTLPREVLEQRIRQRVRAMIAAGLVGEVRAALASGVPRDAPGFSGVGYPEALAHVAGELSEAAMEDAIVVATRQYAKRQETWFRNQVDGPVTTLDATKDPHALARQLLSVYRAALTET
jgi:tRNA dimethylallyltransferase